MQQIIKEENFYKKEIIIYYYKIFWNNIINNYRQIIFIDTIKCIHKINNLLSNINIIYDNYQK